MIVKRNLPDHVRGDTFEGARYTLEVNGAASDLTGASIRMQLKKDKSSATSKEFSTGAGITITDALNGVFEIDKQIISVDANAYVYDIEITYPDETVKTYVEGKWKILQDVTR